MELTRSEEALRYRFLAVSENEVISEFEFASLKPVELEVPSEMKSLSAPTPPKLPKRKTKIAYGFLFQLASTDQITIDQIEISKDDPIHINQISARKVAVYRYSGARSENRYKRMLMIFPNELKRNGVETTGQPVYIRRDVENHFWLTQKNEIWLEVAK